ncbi:TPA: 30S ribosomal protein S8 [Candidatus Poribacteria bacterium]|nr:30S ribosomal protein S8 [Candidatus Poribacteria bacterium]HIA69790.1 30S ribosomal protein S8 [Candidatus Poribacteria bacterium]HIB99159.1 30S ribosomal protein S8 [Candidatus Poribacteria bacterium]HIN28979.1 30S ribosomal protein S8 [Candidatus Poribacteria bacterium]HIO47174.1 30S ribosomal protein S8 [Candidatus Poribacteria bacterium]
MSMTDPVADMLTRIRNANMVRHERVEIPASKLKMEVARILHEEGYIRSYRLIEDRKQGILRIYLKYDDNQEKVISGIRRVSKPGRRVYAGATKIPRVYGDLGVSVLSTSHGVKTGKQCRRERIGGEVLCYVW